MIYFKPTIFQNFKDDKERNLPRICLGFYCF